MNFADNWARGFVEITFLTFGEAQIKGITERFLEEMLQGMMEKLQALEGGRVLDI